MSHRDGYGFLVVTLRKNKGSLKIKLDDEKEITIFLGDHSSGNNNLVKVMVECPKEKRVERSSQSVDD